MSLTPEEIGRRIREARTARGWTNEQLARRLGVHARSVHRWQAGQLPRVQTLIELARVLDVPESYFVEQDDGVTLADVRDQIAELTARVEELARLLERVATRS